MSTIDNMILFGIEQSFKQLRLELEQIKLQNNLIIKELSSIPVVCDKCRKFTEDEVAGKCLKCNDTGIIQNKQRYDWKLGE